MAKIPFDVKFRPQIESGEYKVETREGLPARIICWDRIAKKHNDDDLNLCVLVPDDGGEAVYYYNRYGKRWVPNDDFDLFIVTPEEELTPLEDRLSTYLKNDFEYFSTKKWDEKKWNETMRIQAAELLKLAREQFIKDGYVIEKKAFRDAVENISDKHLAEMSVEYSLHCKVEDGTRHAIMNWEAFQKVAQKFIDLGKAEALKDLPRWEKQDYAPREANIYLPTNELVYHGMAISVDELTKLSGFKEDESHE